MEDGVRLDSNPETAGRYHSNWLSMMYPRLLLARQLLRDDGVIFISIDDHEAHNLRRLMDDIFGEECFLGIFMWHRRQQTDSRNYTNISPDHEYVICYAKGSAGKLNGRQIDVTKYKNPDADPRGQWASIDLSGLATRDQRPNLHYNIVDPATGLSYPPNPDRGWSKSKSVVEQMISEGRVLFPKSPDGRPREKKFLSDLQSMLTGFSTWLDSQDVDFTTNGTRELSALFQGKYFDFPKPSSLIKTFIDQVSGDSDCILDFFAGSGTTAQAVLELNAQDGGNRKFILVQIPEQTPKDSEARKAGYRKISDITIERVKRVIHGYGDTPKPLDAGFKVFRLTQSHFPRADFVPDPDKSETDNIAALHAYIAEKETQLTGLFEPKDIIDEVLLKNRFKLHYTLSAAPEFTQNKIWRADDGEREPSLLCLDQTLHPETVRQLLAEPQAFICLERALETQDKWNLRNGLGQRFVAF